MGWVAVNAAPRRRWSVHALRVLLENRALAAALLAVGGVHLLGTWLLGMPLTDCSFRNITGQPCPGCGLSRAGRLLLEGRLAEMWSMHPFTPYFALWGVMLAGAVFPPAGWRSRWAAAWIALEQRLPLHAVALLVFLVFGAVRLLSAVARSL